MRQMMKRVAAPVAAGTAGCESSNSADLSSSLSFKPVVYRFLEMTPQASRARVLNTLPGDFEHVGQEEMRRQADLKRLRAWSLGQGHCLASQARRNRFRRVWLGSGWGEAA